MKWKLRGSDNFTKSEIPYQSQAKVTWQGKNIDDVIEIIYSDYQKWHHRYKHKKMQAWGNRWIPVSLVSSSPIKCSCFALIAQYWLVPGTDSSSVISEFKPHQRFPLCPRCSVLVGSRNRFEQDLHNKKMLVSLSNDK